MLNICFEFYSIVTHRHISLYEKLIQFSLMWCINKIQINVSFLQQNPSQMNSRNRKSNNPTMTMPSKHISCKILTEKSFLYPNAIEFSERMCIFFPNATKEIKKFTLAGFVIYLSIYHLSTSSSKS